MEKYVVRVIRVESPESMGPEGSRLIDVPGGWEPFAATDDMDDAGRSTKLLWVRKKNSRLHSRHIPSKGGENFGRAL